MNTLQATTILFKNRISSDEVPLFRGSMIRMSGGNLLFHNHQKNNEFRYAYPLIQYKRIDGYAAIVGINEGGDTIRDIANQGVIDCQLGKRNVEMVVADIYSTEQIVDAGTVMKEYEIRRWLPLNKQNYGSYQKMERLVTRISMLEKILVGNILSFAKGVHIYFDSPVICQILQLESRGVFRYKDVELMNFSATFKTNVSLPNFIGLGKSVSINNGVIASV